MKACRGVRGSKPVVRAAGALITLLACSFALGEEPKPPTIAASALEKAAFTQDTALIRELLPAAAQSSKDRALIETVMRLCSPAFQLRDYYGEVRAMQMEFSGGMLDSPQFEAESRRLKEPYADVVKALLDGGANPNAMRVVGWSLGKYTEVPGAPGIMTRSGVTMGAAVDASQGGVSALEIAQQSYHSKLIGLLQAAGAK